MKDSDREPYSYIHQGALPTYNMLKIILYRFHSNGECHYKKKYIKNVCWQGNDYASELGNQPICATFHHLKPTQI